MGTGKEVRLSKIFDPRDGRAVVVAADHGLMLGPIPGVHELERTLRRVVDGRPDAILLSPGQAESMSHLFRGRRAPSLLVRVDWTNTFRDRTYTLPVRETFFSSVSDPRHALKLGAHAVVTYLFLGYEDEEREARHLSLVSRYAAECARFELPLIVEPIPLGPRVTKANSAELVAIATRVAVEVGADALKVPYTGDPESFRKVVQAAAGVPILVLGGYRALSRRDLLEVIVETIEVGGSGVVFGRNVVQAQDPASVLKDLRAIVHEGRSIREVITGGVTKRIRLRTHPERCSGCLICTAICSFIHEGVHDRKAGRLRVEGIWPGPFKLAVCTQCGKCIDACPKNALNRDLSLGYIIWDEEKCDLCSKCVESCALGVVKLQDSKIKICDLCGGSPECAEWCSREVLEVIASS
ncbi:MAG: 4Fe-4S dicluster domain-containing protein [Thermoproteota archaeon]